MGRYMTGLLTLLCGLGFSVAQALPRPLSQLSKDEFLQEGVVILGRAGLPMAISKVEWTHSPSRTRERLSMKLQGSDGEKLEQPGYCHLSLETKPVPRLVLTFSAIADARLSADEVQRAVAQSPWMKRVKFTTDPVDGSTSLSLYFHQPVRWKPQWENGHLMVDFIASREALSERAPALSAGTGGL